MGSYPWGPHGPQSGPNQVTPNPTPSYVPPPAAPTYYPQTQAQRYYGEAAQNTGYAGVATGPRKKHYVLAAMGAYSFVPPSHPIRVIQYDVVMNRMYSSACCCV